MKWLENLLAKLDGSVDDHHGGDITKCPFMNGSLSATPIPAAVETPTVVATEPVLTAFAKIRKEYNPKTDIVVISRELCESLSEEETEWLTGPNTKVIYFDSRFMFNVAVVRAGYTAW